MLMQGSAVQETMGSVGVVGGTEVVEVPIGEFGFVEDLVFVDWIVVDWVVPEFVPVFDEPTPVDLVVVVGVVELGVDVVVVVVGGNVVATVVVVTGVVVVVDCV